jgi:hypothetical protein
VAWRAELADMSLQQNNDPFEAERRAKERRVAIGILLWLGSGLTGLAIIGLQALAWLRTDEWPHLTNGDVYRWTGFAQPHPTWAGANHLLHIVAGWSFAPSLCLAGTALGLVLLADTDSR